MNEVLTEIAIKAQVEHCISHVRLQEFAELIVAECAKIARSHTLEKYPGMVSNYDGIVYVEEAIKKHFGVEK